MNPDGVDLMIPSGNGLKHPVKKIFESPPAYEFGEPIGGTYPLWYDTSYWHEGIEPYFDLNGQVQAIKTSLLFYCALFFSHFTQPFMSVGFLILFATGARRSLGLNNAAAVWPVLIVVISALGLYSLALVESRYIGAFICLLWLGAFFGGAASGVPAIKPADCRGGYCCCCDDVFLSGLVGE
jgi:hypothetical protein